MNNDSENFWKNKLSAEEFDVLFAHGTEIPFTSNLNQELKAGTFICKACNNPLFLSDKKFDSGTGWPSFYQSLEGAVEQQKDYSLFMIRTEYHCSFCGGHQGHVFKDGPKPTGLRFCNNGLSLKFIPYDQVLPEKISPPTVDSDFYSKKYKILYNPDDT